MQEIIKQIAKRIRELEEDAQHWSNKATEAEDEKDATTYETYTYANQQTASELNELLIDIILHNN